MMKEGIDHYESATRIEYTIYEGIKELCFAPIFGVFFQVPRCGEL